MRFKKRGDTLHEGDMTPMIDMVFQLIAFFMVLVNFSEADQNQLIRLPSSELAIPPKSPVETPITIHITEKGSAILGPEQVPVAGLTRLLTVERQMLTRLGKSAKQATVIIRADGGTKIGVVQEVIKVCQDTGFENFSLRAKQQERQQKIIGSS
jgi:biopolymer transport protein ExbD